MKCCKLLKQSSLSTSVLRVDNCSGEKFVKVFKLIRRKPGVIYINAVVVDNCLLVIDDHRSRGVNISMPPEAILHIHHEQDIVKPFIF